jgi:hypothetical protein
MKMLETYGAYELYVTCGLIAQGLLQYLAVAFPARSHSIARDMVPKPSRHGEPDRRNSTS